MTFEADDIFFADNFDARSWSSAPTLTNDEDNSESGGDIESQKLIREEISEKLPMTQDSKIGNPAKFKVDARVISDAIIGLSDGLTVPFALTAGLSAIGNTRVVIFGGMAELIAGAISMGLGGYLGAKSEQCASQSAFWSIPANQTQGFLPSYSLRNSELNSHLARHHPDHYHYHLHRL